MIKTLGFGWDSAVRPLQYLMLAGLLAMGFGFDLGRTFANQQVLSNYFILEGHEADVILGTDILGAILGLFLGGWLVYGSGRKICLLSGSAAGMAGSAAALFAPNLSIMLCAQFVTGFAAGLFTLSLLLYAAEITLPKNRGLGCSMGMTCFAAGALIGAASQSSGRLRAGLESAKKSIQTNQTLAAVSTRRERFFVANRDCVEPSPVYLPVSVL